MSECTTNTGFEKMSIKANDLNKSKLKKFVKQHAFKPEHKVKKDKEEVQEVFLNIEQGTVFGIKSPAKQSVHE